MDRFRLGFIAAVVLGFASSAQGAPRNISSTAPAIVAPSWTGLYGGVSVGARWASNGWQSSDLFPGLGPVDQTEGTGGSMNNVAALIGGYAGFNWQFAKSWVAGIEADITWANNSKYADPLPGLANSFGTTMNPVGTVKETWNGSLRARFGYLIMPDTLIYGTGGVAWQRAELSASCNTVGGFCTIDRAESYAATKSGWTVGGGIEQRLSANWLARIDYRYADFGTFEQVFFAIGGFGDDRFTAHVKMRTHTASIGLAYKF